LICTANILIWDEAPVDNQAIFNRLLNGVDETCHRCMGVDCPFGGKIMRLIIWRFSPDLRRHPRRFLRAGRARVYLTHATTFNSCQGMTLDTVSVDLTREVFSHAYYGRLYKRLSSIRKRGHARIHLRPGMESTVNITCHELLK
jgi:hypothetical protein